MKVKATPCEQPSEPSEKKYRMKVTKRKSKQEDVKRGFLMTGEKPRCGRPRHIPTPGDEFSCKPKKRARCPKFRFIPLHELEAKRKRKSGKKSKTVCLRMMKKGAAKTKNQSCHISTKAQRNEAHLQQLLNKCKGYGDCGGLCTFLAHQRFFLVAVPGVHRITFRLPSYQSRGYSKKGDECKKEREPPCNAKKSKLKPECEKKKRLKCYCLKEQPKVQRTPCELTCEEEVPECRYCKRFEVKEEPQPKRKF